MEIAIIVRFWARLGENPAPTKSWPVGRTSAWTIRLLETIALSIVTFFEQDNGIEIRDPISDFRARILSVFNNYAESCSWPDSDM